MLRALESASRHTLSLLVLFSHLAATVAFTPLYSPGTQCGPFTVTWQASNVTAGPPFVLLILPFDASPAIFKLPDSSYDPTTKTGSYTLDKLPLKSGVQFVVAMDDGYGRATRDVSLIQTVGTSSDASCLTPNDSVSSMSSFFTLDPAIPSQCSSQIVSWNSTRFRESPDIRGFILGGQAFGFNRSISDCTTCQVWDVHVREGTQVVLLVQANQNTSGNSNARTSSLVTVTGKSSQGDSCLGADSPRSTILLASNASNSSLTMLSEPTDPPKDVKVATIAGGVVGGLGLIAIICALIVLYRSFIPKTDTHSSKHRGPGGSSYGISGHQRSRTLASNKNGFMSATGNKSFAGISIASTQASVGPWTTSTRREARHQIDAVGEFGTSLGDDDESRDNSSVYKPPSGAVARAIPTDQLPLDFQGRTEYPPPQQPSRTTGLPLSPPPVVSQTEDTLSDRWEDPSIAYGVPLIDERQTELGDVLTRSRSNSIYDEHDRRPEPERHAWSAHPYANPLAAVNPAPPPARHSPAWSTSSPVPLPSTGVRGDDNDGDGDQAVTAEYAFGPRRARSMRARKD